MRSLRFSLLVAGIVVAGCQGSEPAAHDEPAAHSASSHASPPHASPSSAPTAEASHASPSASKLAATPVFWQRDPEAAFPNGGADYCAPVSLSGGLMYLAAARGMPKLADGAGEKAQIALVKELAKDLKTDPKQGTNADEVLTGLVRYMGERGHAIDKIEIATWRSLSRDNERHRVAQRPDLSWIRAAVAEPDTVVLANVGWYQKDPKGYAREGGHWVNVVGEGAKPEELQIRNSLLKVDEQRVKTAVTVTKLDAFDRVDGKTSTSMTGYYKVEGPALPYGGATVAAVLDCVLVFRPKK